MRDFKVYLIAFFLCILTGILFYFKITYGQEGIRPDDYRNLWHVAMEMHLTGTDARAKVRVTIPQNSGRQILYQENSDHEKVEFYERVRSITGNRIGFWKSENLSGVENISYSFFAVLREARFPIPAQAEIPENPLETYPESLHFWLKPSEYIQSDDKEIGKLLKKITGKSRNAAEVSARIYSFLTHDVAYRSEKGSKDAVATLDQLEADCGGKARLFVALSRNSGIPSRIVGGVLLTPGFKKITHVWAENYIGGTWIPYDPVNHYLGVVPNHYLELYRGDYPLVKHTGLAEFNYFFLISKKRIPPIDDKWSLYSLPLTQQKTVKTLLLIPVGALIVVIFRSVIGIQTFGTFAPILLALAFREISPGTGALFFSAILLLGVLARRLLEKLRILIVAKLSIITSVIAIAVVLTVLWANWHESRNLFHVTLFPLIIITWMIERFCVLEDEDGFRAAFSGLVGTFCVAVAGYFVMVNPSLKSLLFSYPEVLLVVVAGLLVLGRYKGMRVTELFRFRQLMANHDKWKENS